MASFKGTNKTNKDASPIVKISSTMERGVKRHLYDEYTVDSASELTSADTITLFSIPKGARVTGGQLVIPACGASGKATVGWAASAESGAEAADADGLFTTVDPGNAAVDTQMGGTVAGFQKTFSEEVDVLITLSETTADAGGDSWELSLEYVLD